MGGVITLREFLNGILTLIGAASLTDDEYATCSSLSVGFTADVYDGLIDVLDSRESVSTQRERLTYYFKARGVEITEPSAAASNILIGGDLC